MKTGRITAKLRDTVPVCLMVEGKEVKRYKNIELPETFPEPRAKVTRAEKATAKAQKKAEQEEVADTTTLEETALAIIPEEPPIMQAAEPEEATTRPETEEDTTVQAAESPKPAAEAEADQEASTMEISYNVTGPRHKELATAVGDFIGTAPV